MTTETVSSTTSKIPTKQDIPRPQVKQMKKPIKKKRDGKSDGFFHHLSDALPMNETIDLIAIKVESGQIHSSIHALGLKFVTGKIVGGNARCLAMLNAFIKVNSYCFISQSCMLTSGYKRLYISSRCFAF